MGKLNVPKMANFMEVDVYVLVACPENTLIDSQVGLAVCSTNRYSVRSHFMTYSKRVSGERKFLFEAKRQHL